MTRLAFAMAAAGALAIGSAAQAAEPAGGNPRPVETAAPAETAPATAPTLLASAANVQMPTPQNAAVATPAKKPRAARVTSCRCGEASPR